MEKDILLHNHSPENLMWVQHFYQTYSLYSSSAGFTSDVFYSTSCPLPSIWSGSHAHASLVSVSGTAAGSYLVFHDTYTV